jgi:hypothetical protein
MDITDVIRDADSEYVVFFLLTSYIEALQFGNRLPARLTSLPVTGIRDLGRRYQDLVVELDAASRKLDNKARVLITEALQIFDTALHRLALLHATTGKATPVMDGTTASPPSAPDHLVGLYPGFLDDPR